jgi:hypothetical protein
MAQQTAVEWLEDNLIGNPFSEKDFAHNINVFKEAKAMEKEQIIKAASVVLWNNSSNSREEAEQYYNETYQSNQVKADN